MSPPFLVRAVNTAADSENKIHEDRVAAEYGFGGGLVPGVTIYGYMASAVIDHFGEDWLAHGAMDVRFRQPFYEGEQVAVSIEPENEGRIKIEAGDRASGSAWICQANLLGIPHQSLVDRRPASRETMLPGTVLGTLEKTLDLKQPGMSAPLDAYIGEQRHAHPAILLALANEILMTNYTLGPWIHSSSEVRNASSVREGEPVEVRAKIEDAYERKGHEFVVLDVTIQSAGRPVSGIRHTAIWQPRKP